MFDHPDDANDRNGLLGIEPEMFSHGIIMRPEALREILVDDGDLRRVDAVVLIGEEAARDQGICMVAKIVRACVRLIGLQLLARWRSVSFDVEFLPNPPCP